MNTLLLYHQCTTDVDDNLIYKEAGTKQEIFIRDTVCENLLKVPCFIVSTHMSKSVLLPVYGIVLKNGIRVILRNNFYDWKLSVENLPAALPANYLPSDLFTGGINKNISDCYCEGFHSNWVHPSFNPSEEWKDDFTVELSNDYKLYMVLYLLNKAFPEVEFDINQDKRSVEDIKRSIIEIYKENGFYEKDEEDDSQLLSGWRILYRTYIALDDYRKENDNKYDAFDIVKNPERFAQFIVDIPEVKKAFLAEENYFKMNFNNVIRRK